MRNLYQTFHPDSFSYYVTIVIAVLFLYAYLLVLARVGGARTIARLTAFDLVVTIATGAIVGQAIMGDRLPEGIVALTVLSAAHVVVRRVAARTGAFGAIFSNTPIHLVRNRVVAESALEQEGVTREEIDALARAAGYRSLDELEIASLLPNGQIVVVARGDRDETG